VFIQPLQSAPATHDALDRLDSSHCLDVGEMRRKKILQRAERGVVVGVAPLAPPLTCNVSEFNVRRDVRHG
jgi:hypothetical protein